VADLPNDSLDFTDAFCAFLQSAIATVDAAELLLFLSEHRNEQWSVTKLATGVSSRFSPSESETARHIDGLVQAGLVARDGDGRVRYAAPLELDAHVATLARLYVERPVTLFRVIYALRDSKIKTLADAFRIWRK
jgi:hypothetical protein